MENYIMLSLLAFAGFFHPSAVQAELGLESINGKFEIHITVDPKNGVENFKEFCKNEKGIRIKPVLIELPYGESPTQLMTSSHVKGTFANAFQRMKTIEKILEEHGFGIWRSKIEADISAQGLPQTEETLKTFSEHNYFEFHFKVVIPSNDRLTELAQLSLKHGAHLSRNNIATEHPLKEKYRFVTLRLFHTALPEALARCKALKDGLQEQQWAIDEIEEEYAFYDSNLKLDNGWLDHV
jgi:hypothetical protein